MKTKTINSTSLETILGPLWKIYSDQSIGTIFIDSFDDVYYFQKNKNITIKIFKSENELQSLLNRIIKYAGIKEEARTVFLNIDQHTQISIVFPPMSVKGPSIIINKLPGQVVSLEDLVKYKSLDKEGLTLIQNILEKGKGVLVAGNHGSGKTTLLNSLIDAIPQSKRVVTIERYADLVISRDKVCRLQTPHQKVEELIELVSLSERMFPEYLIASNFEGPEVMPFLEIARNNCSALGLITGQNPLDALKRLETKAVTSSEGMSLEDARYAISQSFRHVVFQERREDFKRLVSSISEVSCDAGELKLKVIYKR